MAIHDGHRERLRGRFLKEGLDHFEPINVLELLLFYCIPRVDTNPIAHRLLDHFGSLPNVLEASVEELIKVEGIGQNAAIFLSLLNATSRYYLTKKVDQFNSYLDRNCYVAELQPKFVGHKNEVLYILCLDSQGKKLSCKMVAEGTVSSSSVALRKIAELALSVNASYIVLAHNHPNGVAIPSTDDKEMTKSVYEFMHSVEVALLDHVIFTDTTNISLLNEDGTFKYGS